MSLVTRLRQVLARHQQRRNKRLAKASDDMLAIVKPSLRSLVRSKEYLEFDLPKGHK